MAEKQQRSKIEIGFVSILLIIIGFILSIPFFCGCFYRHLNPIQSLSKYLFEFFQKPGH